MWLLSGLAAFFFTLNLWVLEDHVAQPDRASVKADVFGELDHVESNKKTGYLNLGTLRASGIKQLYHSLLTLTAHESPVVNTNLGLVYSVFFSFFALIWVAAYTANLAAILQTMQAQAPWADMSEFLAAQKADTAGPACVKAGTAYSKWLAINIPQLDLKLVRGSSLELAQAVSEDTGECAVMIDSAPQIQRLVANECKLSLHIAGQPLSYGVQDMAAGVRVGLPGVRDALSYWIQTLRQCGRFDPADVCFM
jgi:hypothetical protein